MLRLLASIYLLPLFASVCSNALLPAYSVEFIVEPGEMPATGSVFLTGNISALGNWDPAGIELVKTDDGLWKTRISVKHGTELMYKVTLGSWDTEALTEDGSIPDNAYLNVVRDTTITIRIPAWKRSIALDNIDKRADTVHTVTFVVESDAVPPGYSVFISGNHEKLGGWQANGAPLEIQPDGSWTKSIEFEDSTYLEYKFTLGTWAREALNEDGTIPENSHLEVHGDQTVRVQIPKWSDGGH